MTEENKSKKTWFSRIKSIALYVFFALALGWGVDFWRAQSIVSGKAPELIATSVQGENIDLIAMSQDKPVMVYFWATWCSVCSFVSPSVDFVDNQMQVVSVALNSGGNERVAQYLSAKDYDFTVVNDEKGHIGKAWEISLTPTIIVVDKGVITSVTTGFTSPFGMWARMLFS
ncbi:protein disulfide oxidoreductase [Psychromonas aquatilis]|uniref:Protein disulfide oxidoreductase n=1 Tax=Psychromonas aquatilis TaxID=2005072 RepID=A0ABU9GPB7_9GAMM